MMKRYMTTGAIAMAALCFSVTTSQAGYTAGYYNSLNGKCGYDLMLAVKAMAKGHKSISYGNATWEAFRSTDVKTVDGTDYWWDMYSNNLVRTSGHDGMNIEHSVANSWWGKTKNDAYKDIVHLNPSDKDANSHKSNYPLSELQTVKWDNGVTFVGVPKSGQGGGNNWGFEPADEYKGDFARAFMYMFCTYNDISWSSDKDWMYDTSNPLLLRPWAQDLLLRWSASDAVSQKERDRNDGIEKEQRNRNPFIDLPDLADHIWGDKKNEPYKVDGAGGGDPVIPDPEDKEVYMWLPSKDSNGDEGWDIDVRQMDSALSYVWKWDNTNGNYYMKGSGYVDKIPYSAEGYVWGPEVDMKDVVSATFSFRHAAKYQTTLRQLCKVAVMNMSVNDEGYIKIFDIPNWPEPNTWDFVNSGDIDLSEYAAANSKIRVGFLYKSTTEGADTWEVNNATLTLKRGSSGVEDIPAEDADDDSCMVEVWGNNILVPEGAVIYDLNGRRVDGENVAAGVYIVVKPSFRKAVKVLVR